MICYSLICSEKHNFQSWFANAEAYDKLKAKKTDIKTEIRFTNTKYILLVKNHNIILHNMTLEIVKTINSGKSN